MDAFLSILLNVFLGCYFCQIIFNVHNLYEYDEYSEQYKNKLDFIYKTFVPVIPYVKFIFVEIFNFFKAFVNNFKKIGKDLK